ncbi:MAG: hypothetical protein GY861_09200 [bacterium]|nr:hypothetical protein [bacterium]
MVLNSLFSSTETKAKKAEQDELIILKCWEGYLKTVIEKEELIKVLPDAFGHATATLKKLKRLLYIDLIDIRLAKKEEKDILPNLESIEKSDKVKRIERLEACLAQYDTRHEYLYGLLLNLYSSLKTEAKLLDKISDAKGIRTYIKLVDQFSAEYAIERKVLAQIGGLETFQDMFPALVKGEHIIHSMDAKEKRLLKKMKKDLPTAFQSMNGRIVQRDHQIAPDENDKKITEQWIIAVFNAIEAEVRELETRGLVEMHPTINFEFVNRPEFVDLVRRTIQELKGPVSEELINVFVHTFREWYTYDVEGVVVC